MIDNKRIEFILNIKIFYKSKYVNILIFDKNKKIKKKVSSFYYIQLKQ